MSRPRKIINLPHGHQDYGRAKRRVIKYFDTEVSKHILRDIEIVSTCAARLCTPLALVLFAVIDLFGFLTRDDEPDPSPEKTRKSYEWLFSHYFPNEYSKNVKKIRVLFRHGVMHQYFAKASAICRGGLSMPLIRKQGGNDVLNLDRLCADLLVAIDGIRRIVYEDSDRSLTLRINRRLNKLKKLDYEQRDKI